MSSSSKYLEALVREFVRLPGMGHKSASRIAFHLLKVPPEEVRRLASALIALRENIRSCEICCGISDGIQCSICEDSLRSNGSICVVEEQKDDGLVRAHRQLVLAAAKLRAQVRGAHV